MKKLTRKIIVLVTLLGLSNTVMFAACQCMCVNNNKQWVCSNSYDVPMGFCGGPCFGYKSEGFNIDDLSNINNQKKNISLCSLDNKKITKVEK